MPELVLGVGLQIGHPDIDRDHREIADMLSRWRSQLARGDGLDNAGNAAAFRKRIADHFADEIEIMAAAGYAEAGEHQQFHDDVLVRIDAILAKGLDGAARSPSAPSRP